MSSAHEWQNNFVVLKKTLKFLNVIVIYMNPIHTCSSDTLYQYTVKPVLCDLSRKNWYTVCSHNTGGCLIQFQLIENALWSEI